MADTILAVDREKDKGYHLSPKIINIKSLAKPAPAFRYQQTA